MEITLSPDDMPSSERVAEWQEMIDSLRAYSFRDLTEWERDFLDSIEAQLSAHGLLTRGQYEKLEELHGEHLGE